MEIGNIIYYLIVLLFVIRSVYNFFNQKKKDALRPNAEPKRKSALEELFESFDLDNTRTQELIPTSSYDNTYKSDSIQEVVVNYDNLEYVEDKMIYQHLQRPEKLIHESVSVELPRKLSNSSSSQRHLTSSVKRQIDDDVIVSEDETGFDLRQAVINDAILHRLA